MVEDVGLEGRGGRQFELGRTGGSPPETGWMDGLLSLGVAEKIWGLGGGGGVGGDRRGWKGAVGEWGVLSRVRLSSVEIIGPTVSLSRGGV